MSNQSRSPSEHSEAERSMSEELKNPLYDILKEALGELGFYNFAAAERLGERVREARATPAEAGERTLPSIEDADLTWDIAAKIAEFYPEEIPRDTEKNHRLARAIQRLLPIKSYGQQCARYAVEKYKRAHHTDKGD